MQTKKVAYINPDLSVNILVLIAERKLKNAFLFVQKFLSSPKEIYFEKLENKFKSTHI